MTNDLVSSLTDNPWTTLSSKVVYKNEWITVREDQVLRPDGEHGIYGVVEPRIATGVVAITPDVQVCLVGQYRYPINRYSWELPEGGASRDESPLEAIQRELAEEAGLRASHWEPLGGVLHLSNCHSDEEGHLFFARELTSVATHPDPTEVLQVRFVPLAQCVQMCNDGEITDSMSVIGIMRAQQYLLAHKL